MKTALILMAVFGLSINQETTVSRIQGIDVYVYSMPNKAYKVLETGKVRITLTGGCGEVVQTAVKKAVKIQADAVIVDMEGANVLGTAWEAIKYQ